MLCLNNLREEKPAGLLEAAQARKNKQNPSTLPKLWAQKSAGLLSSLTGQIQQQWGGPKNLHFLQALGW